MVPRCLSRCGKLTILHNGAYINLLYPYETVRAANVVSTVQLLKMTLTGKNNRKAFHYVSTQSALKEGVSTTAPNTPLLGFGGYALSKLVCEVLINRVEDLVPDLPLVIHRAGAIFAHGTTGHLNIIALIHKMVCGFVQAGIYPDSKTDLGINWTPVDYYSKVMVQLVKTGGVLHSRRQYNISSPNTAKSLLMRGLGDAMRSFGYPVRAVKHKEWCKSLFKIFDEKPGTHILEPFRDYIADGRHAYGADGFDLSPMVSSLKPFVYDEATRTTTVDENEAACVEPPLITEPHIHAVLRFCVEKGYIQPPQ